MTTTHPPAQAAPDAWLTRAHRHLRNAASDLETLIDGYVGQARVGASAIAADLAATRPGARVLEVGAWAGLLSAPLQASGYDVTALEPIGTGFSHMDRLRALVHDYARQQGTAPTPLTLPAEQVTMEASFDLAFSINVMEHVEDVAAVLRRVWAALRPGAAYRFVCPNYRFPYEPHFGIPTLGSKALTWRLFERRILASPVVVDPAGTWASLNWISVAQVRAICRREFGMVPEFDGAVTYRFVMRALGDPSFQHRHGTAMRLAAHTLDGMGLARLAKLMPPGLQPAMSCRLVRQR